MAVDEEELYQDHILDHYEEPYHRGHCPHCTHAHQDDNPLCGDVVRMELQIDDGGTLEEVYFDGDGCCISQAAASMMVEKFDGRTIEEVKKFTANDMLELFGVRLTPNRQKCCLLPWRVLQAAIYSPVDGRGAPTVAAREGHDANEHRRANCRRWTPWPTAADFPILGREVRPGVPLVYFDNAASTQRPRQVIQAIVDCYEEHYANVHRGIHQLAQESDELFDEAREKVRAFINAPDAPSRCIFTSGATAGINLVARSWGDANIQPGDEILLTEMEHHSNLVPWQQLGRAHAAPCCGTSP